MPVAIVMPRQGNSVESCLITAWKKQPGDTVRKGDVLAQVETDKAVIEVESPQDGVLLARYFEAGADVPVLTTIAVVGAAGEDPASLTPAAPAAPPPVASPVSAVSTDYAKDAAPVAAPPPANGAKIAISPRARTLAQENGVYPAALQGSGPEGRIIERDIRAALAQQPALTRQAKALAAAGTPLPESAGGRGPGGRITAAEIVAAAAAPPASIPDAPAPAAPPPAPDDDITIIPLRGVRKITAGRMLKSLQTTAQLTLNAAADARALQAYRARLKDSPEAHGLRGITINDLILFAVSRLLPQFPAVNALLHDDSITQYQTAHLGFAVDTPRGLLVPVIRGASRLSLKQLAAETRRLAEAAAAGKLTPDEMDGGTFTVSNLGSLGIEHFTPVLNPPQVGILGVGTVHLKPVEKDGQVVFWPHLMFSLTIDHQALDGAPAARFLQALTQGIAAFDLLMAW